MARQDERDAKTWRRVKHLQHINKLSSSLRSPPRTITSLAMDPFDDLDTEPVRSKTFKKQVDIDVGSDTEDQPGTWRDAIHSSTTKSSSPPRIGHVSMKSSSLLNVTTADGASMPRKSAAPVVNFLGGGSAFLSKIKRRLNGEPEPQQEKTSHTDSDADGSFDLALKIDTNETEVSFAETQEIESDNTPSISTQTQKIQSQTTDTQEFDTQKVDSSSTATPSLDIHPTQQGSETHWSENEDMDGQTQTIATAETNEGDGDVDETQESAISHTRRKKIAIFSDDEDENMKAAAEGDTQIVSGEPQDTQLVAADAEEEVEPEADTQVVPPRNKLFIDESDSEDEVSPVQTQADGAAARARRLEEKAAQLRAKRLMDQEKERAKKAKDLDSSKKDHMSKLAADINGDNDADEEESAYESEDEDDNLVNAKFEMEATTVKTFGKTDLFAAFSKVKAAKAATSRTTTESEQNNDTPEPTLPSSSPTKVKAELPQADVNLDDESDSDDDFNVQDMFKLPVKPLKDFKIQKLQTSADMKTIGSGKEVIDLDDSDSDSDVQITAPVSKSAMLDIKARFSKRNIEVKKAKQKVVTVTKNSIFAHLKSASKKQIMAQLKERQGDMPDMTKDEIEEVLDVEALLLRHHQHANRVKEQEEKTTHTQSDHDDSDAEYSEVPDSDVPDSDVADSDDDDDDEAELIPSSQMPRGVADKDDGAATAKKSRRKNVIEDEEDEDIDEDIDEERSTKDFSAEINIKEVLARANQDKDTSIDLGFFGGNFSQLGHTQQLKNDLGVSMTQLFEKGSPRADIYGSKVFEELREQNHSIIDADAATREESMTQGESFFDVRPEAGAHVDYDEPSTQLADIEPPSANPSFSVPMTLDPESQKLSATIKDSATQLDSIGLVDQQTQKDVVIERGVQAGADDDDDEDEVHEVQPRQRKRLVKRDELSDADSEGDSDNDEEEENEAEKAERLRQAEFFKEQRLKDLHNERRRKKLLKSKGLDMIMENEAEESEDEWVGVGGADGEKFTEMDSDDEKMFDDITKIKGNRTDLAKKLHDEAAETDQKMLMKILKDLETGNWKRRGAADPDGLDYQDDEDELIRRYRLYKQNKKRQMLEEDSSLRQLAKDKKSQAFFQSITEDSQHDSKKDIFGDEKSASESESDDDDAQNDPFIDKAAENNLRSPEDVSKKVKKKKTITQAYVQKSLSFLNDMEDDDPQPTRNYPDEDDSFEDLHTLKQNSMIQIPDKTPQKKKPIVIEDTNSSPSDLFRLPSMKRSFQSLESEKVRNTDVTISTSAKTASGAGSSIMSLRRGKIASKIDQRTQRVLKAQKVKKQVTASGMLKRLTSLGSSAFE